MKHPFLTLFLFAILHPVFANIALPPCPYGVLESMDRQVSYRAQPIHLGLDYQDHFFPRLFKNNGQEIVLNFDLGPVGKWSKEEMDSIVEDAMEIWNRVAISTVKLVRGEDLPEDVDGTNYREYTFYPSSSHGHLMTKPFGRYNPIIFDDNGDITVGYYPGNRTRINGFASPGVDPQDSRYLSWGFVVINGFLQSDQPELQSELAQELNFNRQQMVNLVAHELGHFLGMGHIPLDSSNAIENLDDVPLMYMRNYRVNNDLHISDIHSLVSYYPTADIHPFLGKISGHFEISSGFIGMEWRYQHHFWLREVDTGMIFSTKGYHQSDEFTFLAPAGRYELFYQAVDRYPEGDNFFYSEDGIGEPTLIEVREGEEVFVHFRQNLNEIDEVLYRRNSALYSPLGTGKEISDTSTFDRRDTVFEYNLEIDGRPIFNQDNVIYPGESIFLEGIMTPQFWQYENGNRGNMVAAALVRSAGSSIENWYTLHQGNWIPWNSSMNGLGEAAPEKEIDIREKILLLDIPELVGFKGTIQVFFGIQRENGNVIFNGQVPLTLVFD